MRVKLLAVVALVACDGDLRFSPDRPDAASDTAAVDARGPDTRPEAKCTSDAECAFASLHCERVSGLCFACLEDAHCTSRERPRCDAASKRCVECGIGADCSGDERCEPVTLRCVRACGGDASACPSDQPICDAKRSICTCTATSCGSGSGERDQCDPSVGDCVECLVDAHCGADKPRCVDRSCHPCRTDADCGGKRCDVVSFECVD